MTEGRTFKEVLGEEYLDATPLLLGETKNYNKINKEEIKKIYDPINPAITKSGFDIDNILKDTMLKKAICTRKMTGKNGYMNVRVPKQRKGLSYNNIILELKDVENILSNNTKYKDINCAEFFTAYCENIKQDLKNKLGNKYNYSTLTQYAPECACYGDRIHEILSEEERAKYTGNMLEEVKKIPSRSQFSTCKMIDNAWEPEGTTVGKIDIPYTNLCGTKIYNDSQMDGLRRMNGSGLNSYCKVGGTGSGTADRTELLNSYHARQAEQEEKEKQAAAEIQEKLKKDLEKRKKKQQEQEEEEQRKKILIIIGVIVGIISIMIIIIVILLVNNKKGKNNKIDKTGKK